MNQPSYGHLRGPPERAGGRRTFWLAQAGAAGLLLALRLRALAWFAPFPGLARAEGQG